MKKVTRIIGAVCMMALLTFVSTSCKKDQQENGEVTISVSIPDIESYNADRAYITQIGVFMWDENDQIRVYNLADEEDAALLSKTSVYTKIGNQTAPTARFRGPSLGARRAMGYRIFYPTCMVKGTDEQISNDLWNENHQTFVVSNEQQYHSYITDDHRYSMVDPQAMPMAQYMNKLSDDATLEHIFGVAAIGLKAQLGTEVVVDRVVLRDKHYNLSGEVSLKLHKVCLNEEQPGYDAAYDLDNVWDAFYNETTGSHAITPEYVQNVLMPVYEYMDYEVDYNTVGDSIVMNCIHNENGVEKGVTLQTGDNYTYFNFMLRPLALHQGFDVLVYVHGQEEPVFLTTDAHMLPNTQVAGDFVFGSGSTPNYKWAMQPGVRKTFIKTIPINYTAK